MILLEVKNLEKIYKKGELNVQVLKKISLQISKGEIVALIGPSGSGKSTLLSIIGTLMKPSAGKVIIDKQEVFLLPEDRLSTFRNKNIGFVFQFHHLLPDFTVLENVCFPAMGAQGALTEEIKNNAQYLLSQVGLDQYLFNKSIELSGGQKQRVAIVRAFINKPKLLLADEPTGNLDPATALKVMQLILNINKEFNTTCLISTHNPEIASHCTRTIQLIDGKIYL